MKIFVFAHRFDVGGSQVNAVDLAVALRDLHGHELVIFATPGNMVKVAEARGLRFLPAPVVNFHPSPAMMRALVHAVRQERPDVMHVWDWWQCLDAYYSAHLLLRIPMVVSDMGSDDIPRLLPKSLPTTFGTPEFVDMARAAGRSRVELLLPPVDVNLDRPGAVDIQPFRERFKIKAGDLTLVTVSRLVGPMKADSLRRSIDAVRRLGRDLPLRFFIVGDGDIKGELEQLAAMANADLGREAVVLTGELLDPRPAYAAADIVIGMGGSALRAMAAGKPTIIVGIQGFSAPFTPETEAAFFYKGIYGKGDGSPDNSRLVGDIRSLAKFPEQLPALGEYARQFVLKHFTIKDVSAGLSNLLVSAAAELPRFHVSLSDGIRTAAIGLGRRFVPDNLRRRVKNSELRKMTG